MKIILQMSIEVIEHVTKTLNYYPLYEGKEILKQLQSLGLNKYEMYRLINSLLDNLQNNNIKDDFISDLLDMIVS